MMKSQGGELLHGKVERSVHSGRGTGELSFFFGMRHIGGIAIFFIMTDSVLIFSDEGLNSLC